MIDTFEHIRILNVSNKKKDLKRLHQSSSKQNINYKEPRLYFIRHQSPTRISTNSRFYTQPAVLFYECRTNLRKKF